MSKRGTTVIEPRRPRLELLAQFGLVFAAAIVYFYVRGLTQGSAAESMSNGHDILRFEQTLGIAVEDTMQSWLVGRDALVTLANWVYIWGHWPVIALTLYWLHHHRSAHYILLRNAIFISGAIGVVLFILYPVAPPRLLDVGLVDTVSERSHAYRVLQPPALVNKFAAMPSLHVGWNFLVGIAIFHFAQRRWLKALGVLSPIAMGLAVVFTANHYVVDGLVGIAVAFVGLVGARWMWTYLYEPRVVVRHLPVVDLRAERSNKRARPAYRQSMPA